MQYKKTMTYDLDWEYIAKHKDMLQIGEELTFERTDGVMMTLQVASIDPDGDGRIALVTKRVAFSSTLDGDPGWAVSAMRAYLNHTLWNVFPPDLQTIIKPRVLPELSISDQLWLLSEYEVFGRSSTMKKPSATLGHRFELFVDADTRVKFMTTVPTPIAWWLRTPAKAEGPNIQMQVGPDGACHSQNKVLASGVVFGLMI